MSPAKVLPFDLIFPVFPRLFSYGLLSGTPPCNRHPKKPCEQIGTSPPHMKTKSNTVFFFCQDKSRVALFT